MKLLDTAVAQIGKLHDGPDVVRLAQEIAARRPQEAAYWREAGPSTAWCGIFQAWNLVVNHGVDLPKSPNAKGLGAMYVDWWLDVGEKVPVDQAQPGDLAIWLGDPHHISMVAGDGKYVGGNQSDGVTRASYRKPDAVRRVSAQISTNPDNPATRFTGIVATVFGGADDPNKSAYDEHIITDDEFGVSLPARIPAPRPKVRVFANGRSVVATIVDVGPWNTTDPYWLHGDRPQAETGTDLTGRTTNKAGIDLTPATARALGINGKGTVDWEFIMDGQTTTVTPPATIERPELKIGSTGAAVIELQKLLGINQSGFFDFPTDAAVRAFQTARGLDVDGEVGKDTWDALLNPGKPTSPAPAIVSSRIDVGRILQFVADHKDDAFRALTIAVNLHNNLHPDRKIALPAAPPAPVSDPPTQRPSVILGVLGAIGTALGFQTGAIGADTSMLSGILSLGTAALGATGGWGKLASIGLTALGALARASTQQK